MASPSVTRYPSEFTATPATDYLQIQLIRRNYKETNKYDLEPAPSGSSNTIYLNMPQKVTEEISQNWSTSSLGEVGQFLGNRSPDARNNLFVDAVKRLAENALLGAAVDNFKKVGASNLSENGILSATSGVVYNPNLEVLYEGPDFRRFNFQFALFTKSEADAQAIYKIVRFFQYASVPSTGGTVDTGAAAGVILDSTQIGVAEGIGQTIAGGIQGAAQGGRAGAVSGVTTPAINTILGAIGQGIGAGAAGVGAIFSGANRFIKQPPFLLLTYKRGGSAHPFLLSPMPCALTGLSIDYTPTGNYTVMNNFGQSEVATVVGVLVNLQLTELKNVFADDYSNQFSNRAPGVTL